MEILKFHGEQWKSIVVLNENFLLHDIARKILMPIN